MSTAVVTQPQLRRGPVTLGPILYFVSVIVCCFGVAMLAPTLLDLVDGNSDYRIFLLCALGTMFVGVTIAFATCSQDTEMSVPERSDAHTSELQSLKRHTYAVFCL